MTKPSLFVFGIDGGDWHVADALIAEGKLPNLAAFRRDAASAPLNCTQPAHTAPGWASLMSARHPGGHGAFQFFHTQDRDYGARTTTSAEVGHTVFDWLERDRLTSGVVNVPMSHPPRPRSGYQISWPLENTLRFSDPPGLLGELARAEAYFLSDLACMYRGSLDYIDQALQNVEHRLRSLSFLLDHHPTDVVMMVLTETDRVCHHYWHLSDASHPAHTGEASALQRRAIEACYVAVDAAFGAILRRLHEDATVVVASDHGSGIGLDDLSLNRLLLEWGLLSLGDVSAHEPRSASWFRADGRSVDWSRTRAYCPVPGSFGINLNMRGRQRQGTVSASESESLLREVEERCRALRSPRDGTPVFAQVLRAEEAYPGLYVREAPDLLLIPSDERTILSGHITGELWRPSYQTGLHRYQGMWMMRSPRVRSGALDTPLSIVDVAPTMLADLGLSAPHGIDGQVREDVFAAPAGRQTGARPARTEATTIEDAVVSERLRAMGYL